MSASSEPTCATSSLLAPTNSELTSATVTRATTATVSAVPTMTIVWKMTASAHPDSASTSKEASSATVLKDTQPLKTEKHVKTSMSALSNTFASTEGVTTFQDLSDAIVYLASRKTSKAPTVPM